MKCLAEIQMLSLALEGDWDGVKKIAMIMEIDALQDFVNVCELLYYKNAKILGDKQKKQALSILELPS